MATVYEEITKATKLKPKPKETEGEFSKRAADCLNDDEKFPDDKFSSLSDETQTWVQDYFKAKDEKIDPPELPGFPNGAASEEKVEETEGDSEAEEAAADRETETKKPTKKVAVKKPAAKKAAPAKKPAAKKAAPKKETAAKPKKEKAARIGKFPLDAKIKILVKENPRRPGTGGYKAFAKYKNGMTVQEALDAGVLPKNLRGDASKKRKYISIG